MYTFKHNNTRFNSVYLMRDMFPFVCATAKSLCETNTDIERRKLSELIRMRIETPVVLAIDDGY